MQDGDEQLKNELIEKTKSEFPGLVFHEVTLANNGDDHAVLILDNKRIVRFPRTEQYKASFKQELGILGALNEKRVPVPNYDYLSKNGDFGSYSFIQGNELRENLFNSLPKDAQGALVKDIARFLSEVHGLPKELVRISENDEGWDSDGIWRYSDRYTKERREILESVIDAELLSKLDQFFENFGNLKSSVRCVIHADLTDDHVLVDSKGTFRGVIDFGDATVGDPAFDFSYFWSYGDWVAEALYAKYAFKDDFRLLDRSRWHFIRFLSDKLFDACKESNHEEIKSITAKLKESLSNLPKLD